MASSATHRLERRSQLLAARLQERVDAMRNALTPAGQRPPFTTTMPKSAALDWWTKHRHDDLGKSALGNYSPDQVAELDAALARRIQSGFEDSAAGDTVPPLEAA